MSGKTWINPARSSAWCIGLAYGFSVSHRPENPAIAGVPVAGQEDVAKRASPLYFVTKDSVPILIMHRDQDPLVPIEESKAFNDALQKAGVESQLVVLLGAGHYGPVFGKPDITKMVGDFFDRHLLSQPAR